MLRELLITTLLLINTTIFCQSPGTLNFQAVIYNNNGNLIKNHDVDFRISILEGSINGDAIYIEYHATSTDKTRQVKLAVGKGFTNNDFALVDWYRGLYYIKIELDVEGGGSITASMGVHVRASNSKFHHPHIPVPEGWQS